MSGSPFLTLVAGVSCQHPGDCVAVGGYFSSSGAAAPMGAVASGGGWRQAVPISLPGNASAQAGSAQPVQGISRGGGS